MANLFKMMEAKYAQEEFNWDELRANESLIKDAMHLFNEEVQSMNAQFRETSIHMFDRSSGKISNPKLDYLVFSEMDKKMIPRKGRFLIKDGKIEYLYESRPFHVLRAQVQDFQDRSYTKWLSNDEIPDDIAETKERMISMFYDLPVDIVESVIDASLDDQVVMTEILNMITYYNLYTGASFVYSGDLGFRLSSNVAAKALNKVGSFYHHPEYAQKLEASRESLSPILSVLNIAQSSLVQAFSAMHDSMDDELRRAQSGIEGEEKIISKLSDLPKFGLFPSATFDFGDQSFETDLLLINQQGLHLLEVKNFASLSSQHHQYEIHPDGRMDKYVNGRFVPSDEQQSLPVQQVERHREILQNAVLEQGYDIPVYSYVVMANDYLSFTNHSDVPVVYDYELPRLLTEGFSYLEASEAKEMIDWLSQKQRTAKRFPKFDYLQAFQDLYQEILESTVQFLKYEMYEEIDPNTFLAVSVFANYSITAMYPRLEFEEINQISMASRGEKYRETIGEYFEDWSLSDRLSLFFYPGAYRVVGTHRYTKYLLIFNIWSIIAWMVSFGFLSDLFYPWFYESFISGFGMIWFSLIAPLMNNRILERYVIQHHYEFAEELSQVKIPAFSFKFSDIIANFIQASYRVEHGTSVLKNVSHPGNIILMIPLIIPYLSIYSSVLQILYLVYAVWMTIKLIGHRIEDWL